MTTSSSPSEELQDTILHAKAAFYCGDFESAEEYFSRAAALEPLETAHLYHLGVICVETRRYEAARDLFDRLLSLNPDHAVALRYRRWLRALEGQFETAGPPGTNALREKLWRVLCHLDDPGEQRRGLLAALEDPGLSTDERIRIHFALTQTSDELGDYDAAARHAVEANRLHREQLYFDSDAWTRFTDNIIRSFTSEFLERCDWGGPTTPTPIFVVGMPRSGTTLTETILSRHPLVYAAGELGAASKVIPDLVTRFGGETYPSVAAHMDPDTARALTGKALGVLRRDAGDASFVTDKLPFGFRELGLIQILFPNAKVIHCRRHPLDICLSIFTNQLPPLTFSSSLDEIGRVWLDYRRMMHHWAENSSLSILSVDYEELVTDQEAQTRRLLEHCGLAWDPACLRFFESDRLVFTASTWQVRQPVYTSSVGRWRHYREMLAPLIELIEGDGTSVDDPNVSRF